MKLSKNIEFIEVENKKWLEPKSFLTILLQILGTIRFTLNALEKFQPDIFIDTQGFAFSYFIVKWILPKCLIISYVHYPFIRYKMN